MDIDDLAETIERTRYALMRGVTWEALRDGERAARVELGRRALVESGLAATLDRLEEEAARVPDLEAQVRQRDEHIADRRAQHEVALAQRDGRIEQLEDLLATAEAATAEALERTAALEEQLAEIRAFTAGAERTGVERTGSTASAPRRFGRVRTARPATA
ncbi:hypothetical protein Q9R32_09345 [Actinotalea sp. AC32]|nr:hypothetical protein [Actinotalea sp. AC32]